MVTMRQVMDGNISLTHLWTFSQSDWQMQGLARATRRTAATLIPDTFCLKYQHSYTVTTLLTVLP